MKEINNKNYSAIIKQSRNMSVIFFDGLAKATASMSTKERNLLTMCLLVHLMSANIPVIAEMENTTIDNLLADLIITVKETIEKMQQEKQKILEKSLS